MTIIIILTILFLVCARFTLVAFAQDYAKKQAAIIADNARNDAYNDAILTLQKRKNNQKSQNLIEHEGV